MGEKILDQVDFDRLEAMVMEAREKLTRTVGFFEPTEMLSLKLQKLLDHIDEFNDDLNEVHPIVDEDDDDAPAVAPTGLTPEERADFDTVKDRVAALETFVGLTKPSLKSSS